MISLTIFLPSSHRCTLHPACKSLLWHVSSMRSSVQSFSDTKWRDRSQGREYRNKFPDFVRIEHACCIDRRCTQAIPGSLVSGDRLNKASTAPTRTGGSCLWATTMMRFVVTFPSIVAHPIADNASLIRLDIVGCPEEWPEPGQRTASTCKYSDVPDLGIRYASVLRVLPTVPPLSWK